MTEWRRRADAIEKERRAREASRLLNEPLYEKELQARETYGPDLLELMRMHGNVEYNVEPPSPGIGLGQPLARSRLCMSPGTDCYMQFSAPLPNWWRRFWTWALLGWVWTEVK